MIIDCEGLPSSYLRWICLLQDYKIGFDQQIFGRWKWNDLDVDVIRLQLWIGCCWNAEKTLHHACWYPVSNRREPASITWNGNTGFTGHRPWLKQVRFQVFMKGIQYWGRAYCTIIDNLNSKSKWIYLGLYKLAMISSIFTPALMTMFRCIHAIIPHVETTPDGNVNYIPI